MRNLADVDKKLDDVFVKRAPALPDNTKQWIVQYLPWINAALGIFALWAVYALWDWAHWTSEWADYANSLAIVTGAAPISTNRWTLGIWLSLAVLLVQASVYILAFPALRARKRSGWTLLFYASLINVAYGLVVMLTDYGTFGSFIGSLIGSALGFYFLFQIRERYLGVPTQVRTVRATLK